MALKITCRLFKLSRRIVSCHVFSSASSYSERFTVKHDRQNQRFTVFPGSGAAGPNECAVLYYRFTGQKEVDLMSTFVPEIIRGQGIAAVLSQAAMDFLVEENLKARVSCWYIKKYIEEQPQQQYKDLIIS